MIPLFRSVIDIRSEERLAALLLGSSYFFLLMTHYLLKPARDALFLVGASAEQLPWVYLLTALLTAPVIGFYAHASRSYTIRQTLYGTWILLALQIVGLRFLLELEQIWVYYLFYAWFGLFGALTTSQFWLLAGTLFDSGQAKRIFPHLGTFGILGAVAGGEITGVLVGGVDLATPDLLWIALVLLALTLILFTNVGRNEGGDPAVQDSGTEERDTAGESKGALKLLRRTPHLMITVGIIGASVVATTLVDYQFKTLASVAHTDASSLTGFFATFYGRVSAVSLVLQFLSPLIVSRLGAAGILLLLPSLLLSGTAAILIAPALLAATFTQGSALTLEYSLDKTGRELLFLPVPAEVKRRTKMFIDLFVDRSFRGLAGLLLLLLTGVLGFGAWEIAWIVAAILILWLGLVLRMRPQYVDAFRRALARRELDLDTGLATHDPAALGALVREIEADDPRRVSYALFQLQSFAPRELEPFGLPAALCPLATREEPEVRSAALALLAASWPDYPELDIEYAMEAPEPSVRTSGVFLHLASTPGPERAARFAALLRSEKENLVVAALEVFADHRGSLDLELPREEASALAPRQGRRSPHLRAALVRAIGRSPDPELDPLLEELVRDRSPEVQLEAIEATGHRRRPEYVPWLLSRLANPKLRPVARRALAAYGEPLVDTLSLALHDLSLPPEARAEIPKVLESIDSKESFRVLLEEVISGSSPLSDACLVAASRLRRRCPWRHATRSEVDAALHRVGRELFAADQATRALRSAALEEPALDLLRQALRERRELSFDQVFALLGLTYRPRDLDGALRSLRSRSRSSRANAREFLGELLTGETSRIVECAIGERGRDRAEVGHTLYGLRIATPEEAVRHYIHSPRPWLRACAIWAAARLDRNKFRERFLEAESDETALVRETARLALGRRAVRGEL